MSDDAMKRAKENWELYYTLTKEMLKYIEAADIEQFLEIERQRAVIVERMKELPETETYRQTEECRELVQEIKPIDMQVLYKAKTWLNKSRRQNATVHSYDLQHVNPIGNILNRKY